MFNSNPMVVAPEQEKLERGLQREDLFTVVSEHFLTDTARFADIVLPATTQLEQFDVMFSWGHLYLTLNEPAIAPLGEAVPNTELFRRLARTRWASTTRSGRAPTSRWPKRRSIGRARCSRGSTWRASGPRATRG